jgi:hypothetical protein
MSSAANVSLLPPTPENVFALSRQGAVEGAAKRELLDRARAEALLQPLLQRPPSAQAASIQKLVLGGKSFGSESAPVLAEALQATPALVVSRMLDSRCVCNIQRCTDELCLVVCDCW